MKIINPLQINDWPIKSFLIMILSIQLSLWGFIFSDSIGLGMPLIRQLICLIYLFFVPGIITLRILKFHKLSNTEVLVYGVGLSISIVMFTGLFINGVYPLIGISNPISTIPLVTTISFVVLLLCVICFIVDGNFSAPSYFDLNRLFSIPALFLFLIPWLTILGTYMLNFYDSNLLLLIVLFVIPLIAISVALDRIPNSLYPLAIFVISISLLLHTSLRSMYIFGWDIQSEYYSAHAVIANSRWDSTLYSNINGMLSVVILPPIYSVLSGLSLTWTFKVIYPIIYSLLPLGLYRIFRTQTNDKIAFMSAFFFMSFFVFYTEMLQLVRQQIAEIFLMLILLLMIEYKHTVPYRTLLIVFGFSMIVSHYGTSYIVMISIIVSLILFLFYTKFFKNIHENHKCINSSLVLLLATFLTGWYLYVARSSLLDTFIYIIDNVVTSLINDFMNPEKAQGLSIIVRKANTPLHQLAKVFHIITQALISIGLAYVLSKVFLRKESRFNEEYLSLSAAFFIFLLGAIAVPNLASSFNTSRLYHITLIPLAAFCIIGGLFTFDIFSKIFRLNIQNSKDKSIKILSVFFSIFLLFNSGWAYELAHDEPTSFALNSKFDYPISSERDIIGKDWLCQKFVVKDNSHPAIFADNYRFCFFASSLDKRYFAVFPENVSDLPNDIYYYFSDFNTLNNKVRVNDIPTYVNQSYFVALKYKIYNNGGSEIYST